ncbi:glycosyltransferase family 2 protein [Georgenia thermotolerans]|uniref:Glycosyltransferase n=1 Tax=Georgenia thermotolerans TaxID=527326 RepID=A0A7J5URB2_9MICO|nr:glycosyltransferase family 2 protein [Georgenia thermotolerans]KAE8764889.1 glycosyltransferase [Georgenia thermotolerans]
MTPAVSVVIPSYNRSATIVPAIASVLRQTFTDLEVLVVDDGSTDDTVAQAERLPDPRLRVLRSTANAGVSAARNRGVEHARGAWVAFQDSDDEWLPTKLEKQLARLGTAGPDHVGAYCGMLVVGALEEHGGRTEVRYVPEPETRLVEGDILPTLLRTSTVSTQTMVVRRRDLLRVGGFDEQLRSLVDWDLALRLSRVGPWAFVDEPLVLQRFSANSLTHGVERRVRSTVRVVEKNLDLLEERPRVLAEHYRTIAGAYRRLGRFAEARDYLRRARGLRRTDGRLWALAACTEAAGLVRCGPGRGRR